MQFRKNSLISEKMMTEAKLLLCEFITKEYIVDYQSSIKIGG
jgi:hypothetical protein